MKLKHSLNLPSSLYRANTLEDAEDKFNSFVLRVPLMASMVKEVREIQISRLFPNNHFLMPHPVLVELSPLTNFPPLHRCPT